MSSTVSDEDGILELAVRYMDGRRPTPDALAPVNVEHAFALRVGQPFLTQTIQTRDVFPIPTELLDKLRANNHGAPVPQPALGLHYAVSRPGVASDGQTAVVVVHMRSGDRGVLDFLYMENRHRQWTTIAVGPCSATP